MARRDRPQGRVLPSLYDSSTLQRLIAAGYTLLTPNQRLARRLLAECTGAGGGEEGQPEAGPLPIHALETWLQERWQAALQQDLLASQTLLSGGQVEELWRQVIAADQSSRGGYDLLQPGAAARLAARARDTLLRWDIALQDPAVQQLFQFDEDCATFLRWCEAFSARLRRQRLVTATDALLQLAELDTRAAGHRLALLEFDTLPPLYRRCLGAQAASLEHIDAEPVTAECRLLRCEDARAELAAVARWAAELARERPTASIGIVLADTGRDRAALDYLLRREFDCLGKRYHSLPVNFSAGIPLAQVPLVRDALLVLALESDGIAVTALGQLLHSRFLVLPDRDSGAQLQLLAHCHDLLRETLSLRQLLAEIEEGRSQWRELRLAQILRQVRALGAGGQRRRPSAWAELLQRQLECWQWPGRGLDSLEFQQLEQWQELLQYYASFDLLVPSINYREALQLLRRCAGEKLFQPQTADSNIQVLGPLEASGLRFDALWLCGMQASQWPAPARPHPFIPLSLQRRHEMPHASAEREWAFADTLLRHYQRATPLLLASYSAQRDGVPELPSPLLADFQVITASPPAAISPAWSARAAGGRLQQYDDRLAPPLHDAERATLGGGSGLLEDQSHCPFRAFARHRLQLRPLPEPEPGLSAAERGTVLHAALYQLWGRLRDQQTLLRLDPGQLESIISEAANAAMDGMPARRRQALGSALCQLETQRLTRLLREWLPLERERFPFRVVAREMSASVQLAGLELALRVDRIDQLEDGSSVIIDYKSGAATIADWLGSRPAKPQLPLYGLAADGPPAGLAFATVRERTCQFSGLARTEVGPGIHTDIETQTRRRMPSPDWPALLAAWQQVVETLAAAFTGGEAAVDPLSTNSCSHCGLQALCRIEQHRAAPGDEAGA